MLCCVVLCCVVLCLSVVYCLEGSGVKVEKLGIDTVELENGCICCSSSEELITSLANIISRDAEKASRKK